MFAAINTSPTHTTSPASPPARPQRHLRIVEPLAPAARPAAQKPAEMRTLHLIDIENLAGGPSAADPRRALGFYMLKVGWLHSDVSYIAACGLMMERLVFDIAEMPCRTFTANGTDGADRKLLEHSDPAWIASRFDRLVIGSGDGIFADVAKQARLLGVRVEVVSPRNSRSRHLARQAHQLHDLPTTWAELLNVRPRKLPEAA